MEKYSDKLTLIKNDENQYKALTANTSTTVKAGPGSGKTTVLTVKIKQLLTEKIIEPRGIVCLTYSNSAVKNFTKKLKEIDVSKSKRIVLSTVHGFCISQIIIPFHKLYRTKIKVPIEIIENSNKKKIFDKIIDESDIPISFNLEQVEEYRNKMFGSRSKVTFKKDEELEKLCLLFEKKILEKGLCDFNLIISESLNLLEREPYILKCIEAKFPWILVDEYQDLGKILHEIILLFLEKTNIKIFVVGDPDQSIYKFQGALPDYFFELYDHPKMKNVTLTTNYRSRQEIIDSILKSMNWDDREYVSGIKNQFPASIEFYVCNNNMEDQYRFIAKKLIPYINKKGIPYSEICVLVGYNQQLDDLSNVLEEEKIPYYREGISFLKIKTILWIQDCCAYVSGSDKVSFNDISMEWDFLSNNNSTDFQNKVTLFKILEQSKTNKKSLKKWLIQIIASLNLIDILINSPYSSEIKDVKLFIKQIEKNEILKDYTTEQFGNMSVLDNQITISTRHSSKGLEFEKIIMLGMEEGNFPNYKHKKNSPEYQEDMRVFFVSLTRAKSGIYLIRSKNISGISQYGNPYCFPKKPSPFWNLLKESKNLNPE